MGLLDDRPFSPSHPDALLLVQRLYLLIGSRDQAVSIAVLAGIPEGVVDWSGPMVDVWPRVLRKAAELDRLRPLAREVQAVVPADELFTRLLAERPAGLAVAGADGRPFWNTPRLWTTEAMIDRSTLRDKVKKVAGPEGCRVLFVTGKSGTGKSNARHFLSFLSEKGELPVVRVIDNSRRAGAPMTVQELAQLIATAVEGRDAPTFDLAAQPESVVTLFGIWLSGLAAAPAGEPPLWLAFDGFTEQTATGAAIQLIHDLAVAVADYQYPSLRVAVCGFDGFLPVQAGADHELLVHPTEADVKTFFKRMSQLLTDQPSEDDAIDLVYAKFLERIGGSLEGERLGVIGPSALALAHEIYEGAPA